jgi:hypothetical protein
VPVGRDCGGVSVTVTGRGEHDTETRAGRRWWTDGQVIYMGEPSVFAAAASVLAAEVIAKLHNDIAAAVRAEHGEQIAQRIEKLPLTVGPLTPGSTLTHRPLSAAEVRERAARLAREAQS